MVSILEEVIQNYDLLFGEQTKIRFSFRESSRDWLEGVTKKEIKEDIKKLSKKEKDSNKLIKKVRKIYPAVALSIIIAVLLDLMRQNLVQTDTPIEPKEFDDDLKKEEVKEIERDREVDFNQPSSFVGTVTYTIDLQTMEIELNGRIYGYCNIPQRLFDSFQGSPSKGKFYNRSIKGQFLC